MRRGDFEEAWRISDQVPQLPGTGGPPLPRHLQSIWNGEPLDHRRVLVRCYHGLGDTIQFIRFIPALSARARRVIVWMQPALIPLLGDYPGIDEVWPLHDGEPHVTYDVDVEIMELPFALRTTLASIPVAVPYLKTTGERLARPHGPAVGLVWRAGTWAEHRSIPFHVLEPLTRLPVTWYVLQGKPGIAERPPGFGIVRGTEDIVETARVIAGLDLLISVDSMAAHLGGAVGARVWTLLHHDADWRWMVDRVDSPWYPTMRLFRQAAGEEWTSVVARVASALSGVLRGVG